MARFSRSVTVIEQHPDEELLGLTGIRALHPEDEPNSTLQYGIFVDEDGRFIIYLKSSNYRQFKVIIDFANMIITNDLVIGQDNISGITLTCLKLQAEKAHNAKFKTIKLLAYRDDANPISWYGKIIPWIGYAVWGKFGFLMAEKFRLEIFCPLMQKNKCAERLIHEIYSGTAEANISKEIWKDKGESWYGKFELKQPGLSFSILNAL